MNEVSKSTFLDVERLQQLSYERSKKWANFFDGIVSSENHEVIDLNDFEKVFADDEENLDDLVSMEDDGDSEDKAALESDVLRDITNTMLMFNSYNKSAKLSETTMMQCENNELVDLFNQTMPVINEHNRQMKESGFDNILNTFDAKKIEEKVGGWLRRNNSLCAPDYTASVRVNGNSGKMQNPYYVGQKARHHSRYRDDDADSDDSFNSGETARYIRSSRTGAIKTYSSPTMTIKTYRMVKSTRQALKDKYDCAQDYDAEVHLNKLRYRRRIANKVDDLHAIEMNTLRAPKTKRQYIQPPSQQAPHTIRRRRKVLRKRSASISCSAKDTSSSSESDTASCRLSSFKYYERKHKKCCEEYHQSTKRRNRVARRTPWNHRIQMYYYRQSHSHSISSSPVFSPSLPAITNTVSKIVRKCSDKRKYSDYRPIKPESKCSCCNEQRVCQEYTHIADTSTDDWLVENSYTSKKLHITPPPLSNQILCNPSLTNNKLSTMGKMNVDDDESIITSTSRNIDSPATPVLHPPTKNSSKKLVKSAIKNTEESEESLEESFEMELQQALKASKELYEKEQKEKLKKNQLKIVKKQKHLPTKPLVKTSSEDVATIVKPNLKRQLYQEDLALLDKLQQKTSKLKESREDKNQQKTSKLKETSTEDKNHQKTSKLKETATEDKIQQKTSQLKVSTKVNKEFLLNSSTNSKSLLKDKNSTIDGSEEAFFAASTRVCNSTALPNNKSACQRQIDSDTELHANEIDVNHSHVPSTPSRKLLKTSTSSSSSVLVYGEEIDKAEKKSSQDIKDINVNGTPLNVRKTKLPRTSSLDLNPDVEKVKNSKSTSKKLRKLDTEEEIIDNDGFVKPRERPKKPITTTKSETKTGSTKKSTDVKYQNSEFQHQTIKPNENNCNVEQSTVKSNKSKEETENLAVESNDKEQRDNAKQETCCNESNAYNIKSNLLIQKSVNEKIKSNHHSMESSSNLELKNQENNTFVKQQKELVCFETPSRARFERCSVQGPSTSFLRKNESQKQIIDSISIINSGATNNTDFVPSTPQIKQQLTNPTNATPKTASRHNYKNNSNVSNNTQHSSDKSKYLHKTNIARKRAGIIIISGSSASEEESNCTVVSSSTHVEPYKLPLADHQTEAEAITSSTHSLHTLNLTSTTTRKSQSQLHDRKKGILIYTPKNPSLAPDKSFSNDGCFFHITKEHISSFIGEKPAEKFLKYYIGRRRFNTSSTVYFKPPAARVLDTNDALSSDSDVDDLEKLGQYGCLYEDVGGEDAASSYDDEIDKNSRHS